MSEWRAVETDLDDEEESYQHSSVVPVPIFAPILPPKLSSISHESLVKWKKRRIEYEAKMRARCRSSGEDYNLVTLGVKESVDLNLLATFCSLRLRKDVADVTEEQLIAEIETLLGKVKNDDLPDIKTLFLKELQMDLKETDVDARVLSYFQRFAEIVLENGLEEVFSGTDGEAEKCKRLVASLAPPVLKEDVKNAVRWTHKAAARSMQELYTLVYEKAVQHERHFQQNKRLRLMAKDKPALPKSAKNTGKAAVQSKKPANAEPEKKFKQRSAERKVEKMTGKKKDKQHASRKEPPSPCPKCQEKHWLSDCTKATDAEKVALREKLREASKARKSRTKRLKKLMPSTSRTVTINGILDLPCCPDTGSDHTVISRSQWKSLLEVDPTVQKIPLDTPVRSLAYGSHPVVATEKVLLHVLIHTAAGPVQPAEAVPCLIMDVDDDEFIIGRDLLGSLGIDVDRQLEQLASNVDDETSGDPFELEADELPADPNHVASDEEVRAAVEVLIERALKHGFPVDKVDKLRVIVHMYDVWRLELRDDPPARVPPLEVRLKEGAQPCKCKPRKYPPHVRQFLREFNAILVELGWIYENPISRWASPVLPVKKSQELMDMRQTTDYREFNSRTDIMAAVMPILSLVMENARGKQHFGLFDFIKGFWQLPLAEFCQEWLSYMTDEKIYTPRRVPQGCGDAAIYFQKTMEKCFATLLYKHLLVWIDDLLLYADDIDTYLDKLKELFSLLDEFGLKLSVKKSSLYQREVKWCGKIIDANGVRHDPARIETLRAMRYPSSAGELQQFLCAINWMRESLIDYARQVSPLQRKLDEALAKTRRTKRAAAGISIELSADEKSTFDNVKEMLASAATLAFPDDSATTCLLTDASDVGWALIVTQVKGYNPKVPVQDQQHQLVECLSGCFTGSQLNWTVIEKEAFPIALACDKLDYLLLRPQGFRLFCDHRNLIHVFAPDEHVKKHVKGKLLRWALKLMNYNYVIEHIAGPQNVWADMISRWAGNRPTVAATIKRVRSTPLVAQQEQQPEVVEPSISMLRPLDDSNFVWPTFAEISMIQSGYDPPQGAERTETGVLALNNRVWIPVEAKDLILRLFIIAHCGAQGHRGIAAMVEHLRRLFALENLRSLASTFVRQCRLCLHSKGGNIIPRPWGETFDCSERNGLLHFDFLSMGDGFGESKYILVLKDHASHFCELVVADTADSSVTVEAFLDWHSRFGLPPNWISDQGSHFKNEVVSELSRRLRTQQDFTPAYCPWINGSVERVNRDILQVIRTMILEYKIAHRDWVYLIPMVQSSLNHTAVPSLGNRAPVELFTGLPCPTPLREFYLPSTGEFKEVPACDKIDGFLDNLRSSIFSMHKVVEDQRLKQRMLNKKRERGENLVNFTEGDYVLRSRVDEKRSNKLLVTWVGPYRVIRADSHSFLVKHLITGAELDVHASRLKFYADSSLDVSEELLEHIASQGIVLGIEKFKSHRWNDTIRDFEVLVQWKGFEDIEDSYEPLASLAKDVPILVNQYVAAADQELKAHWQRATTAGETTLQGQMAVTETAKPTDKNRRRSRRRRSPIRSTTHAQVPSRILPAVAALQTTGVERGTYNNRPDASTSRLVAVQADEGSVSRRTRSRAAGADRLAAITGKK